MAKLEIDFNEVYKRTNTSYKPIFDPQTYQLVPDNYRIAEFVEAFIKFKVFEILTNQTNDERLILESRHVVTEVSKSIYEHE